MNDRSWIPNAITLSGVALGAVGGVWMAQGALAAGLCVWWAGVMADNVDGMVARRLNAATPLGGQLDALGDLVLYGVAPFLLVSTEGTAGLLAGAAMLMACAWRLGNDVQSDAKGVHFGALVVVYLAGVPWVGSSMLLPFALLNLAWLVFAPALPHAGLRMLLACWGLVGFVGAVRALI